MLKVVKLASFIDTNNLCSKGSLNAPNTAKFALLVFIAYLLVNIDLANSKNDVLPPPSTPLIIGTALVLLCGK